MNVHRIHPQRPLVGIRWPSCWSPRSRSRPAWPSARRQSAKATTITALIGSSGPAETNAVNNAATALTKRTGIKVNVIVASDLGQQLAQGFASGNPPDIFYLGNDQVATYAKAGDLAPLDKLKNVKSFYPSLQGRVHLQGSPLRRAEGLLDARPRHQHGVVEEGGADGQELPEDVGRSFPPSRRS